MFLVLEIVFIKKLRMILQSNYLYVAIIFLVLIYLIIKIGFIRNESFYKGNESVITGEVLDFSITEEKVTLILKSKEKIQVSYYFKGDEYDLYKDKILFGKSITFEGAMNLPSNNTIPNAFNYKKYLNYKNIFYVFKADKIIFGKNKLNIFYKIKNLIYKRVVCLDKKGYLKAFILGKKDNLEFYENYQKLGVAHLFAISGMHIGLFSSIILKGLKRINKKKRYFIVNIFLLVYGFITGFSASVKRSLMFFILSSLNKVYEFNISNMKIYILAISLLIILDCNIVFDVGFLYSAVTVLGILYCSDYLQKGNYLTKALKTSIVAFLFSLPIALSNFYMINFLSIIYNIFYIPFVSIVVYPLALLTFVLPIFKVLFIYSIEILEMISSILINIDFLVLKMGMEGWIIGLYYIVLICFFKKFNKYFILILILIVIYSKYSGYLDSNVYVYFFDVNQGDCSLIIGPNQKYIILIDTGGIVSYNNDSDYYVSDNVINFLNSKGISSLDFLILSHGDYDHMGEAINLVNNFKVEKVIFNCGEFNDLEKELIKVLDKKKIKYYPCIKEINIDKNKLYFLQTKEYDNENDNSNVIYTELDGYKFMFMGDASVTTEHEILDKYNLSDIDVLKVGHHGSKTSSNEEFIGEINPKYSVISVGKNNRYGHPNKEVLENLDDYKIYRTDHDGSIIFKIKNNKLKIETCSP